MRGENSRIWWFLQVTDPSFDTLLTLAEAPANGRILHKSSALSTMVFLSRGSGRPSGQRLLYEDPSVSDSLQTGQNVKNSKDPPKAPEAKNETSPSAESKESLK